MSVTPFGAATVAVLTRLPARWKSAHHREVTVAPTVKFTVVLMLPAPLEAATLAPAETAAVQVSLAMPAGSVSLTEWP